MKLICNILIIWFLVIQAFSMDGLAITSIPMQNREYCEAAIFAIKSKEWVQPHYNCVDAGQITIRI